MSVVDPVGSVLFGRIRIYIVKCENGSGTDQPDPGSEISEIRQKI